VFPSYLVNTKYYLNKASTVTLNLDGAMGTVVTSDIVESTKSYVMIQSLAGLETAVELK